MADFMFYQPTRIDFGAGKLEKAGEIVASYGDSCLLVTTTNKEDVLRPLYDRVKKILEKAGIRYVHFDEVVPNPDIRGIAKAIEIVNKEKLAVPWIQLKLWHCSMMQEKSTGKKYFQNIPALLLYMNFRGKVYCR